LFEGVIKAFGETSVLGWVLVGLGVIVFGPTAKNVVREAAVGTAKGVIALAEGGNSLASNVKHGWEGVVAEAKAKKGSFDPNITLGAAAGGAMGATVGGMAGSMGGPVGAAVGGGLGGAVGASMGSELKSEMKKEETKESNTSNKNSY